MELNENYLKIYFWCKSVSLVRSFRSTLKCLINGGSKNEKSDIFHVFNKRGGGGGEGQNKRGVKF